MKKETLPLSFPVQSGTVSVPAHLGAFLVVLMESAVSSGSHQVAPIDGGQSPCLCLCFSEFSSLPRCLSKGEVGSLPLADSQPSSPSVLKIQKKIPYTSLIPLGQ